VAKLSKTNVAANAITAQGKNGRKVRKSMNIKCVSFASAVEGEVGEKCRTRVDTRILELEQQEPCSSIFIHDKFLYSRCIKHSRLKFIRKINKINVFYG
jgi:citrate lyase synthetase